MESNQTVLAALEASEARYRHLVENASDGIYRISTEGYFLYANPIATRVLGAGTSIVGRHYLEFVRQDFHEDIQQFYYQQVRERTSSTYYEFPAVAADARELWIGQRVQIEFDDRGRVKGLHAVARDITDRKHLEDELRQADKMRVVGQLAGGIAHDFSSILTTICGFADVLIQSLGAHDPRKSDAVEIRHAADKAAQLTSQLLTFSRRELFRPHLLNVNAVIEDIRPMITQILGPTITLEIQLGRVSDIRADTGQLEQVLLNFALNAGDAMPAGGTFTIRTENCYIGAGSVREPTLYPGPYVLLSVSDTGAGMDEATRAKVFEPFFTTKARHHRPGLGLSTTFGIIQQAGGRIIVDSTVGSGTTFRIYLPQARSSETYRTPVRGVPLVSQHGVVLVADDEDSVRGVLTRVLEANGYQVISAVNGVEALTKAKQHSGSIDLLLTDLVMPQMGGFELAEAFMTMRPASQVLFMSGYIDQRTLDQGQESRVRLLHKPFDSETVLAEVKRIINMTHTNHASS